MRKEKQRRGKGERGKGREKNSRQRFGSDPSTKLVTSVKINAALLRAVFILAFQKV